nr:hypothetical protein BaRGS_030451 [Batillaria attramentaria]
MEKKRDSFRKIKARRDKPVVTVLGGAGGPTSVEMPQAVFNQPVMYNVDYDRMFGATVPYPGLENQIAGLETIDLARPAVPRAAPAQPKPEPKKKKTKPKKHVGTSDSSSSDEKKKKADEQKKVTSPPTSSRGDVQPMDMPLSSPKPPVEEKIEVIETPFGKMDEPDPMSDTDDLDF